MQEAESFEGLQDVDTSVAEYNAFIRRLRAQEE